MATEPGDRVTMRLGESVVYGVVHEVKHGGASVTVKVDGFEQHAMWFAMPPWSAVTLSARTEP